MVFNANINNISAISWQLVLLIEDTGNEQPVANENEQPVANNRQTSSPNVVSSTQRYEGDSNTQHLWRYAPVTYVVINPATMRSLLRRPPLYIEAAMLYLSYTCR